MRLFFLGECVQSVLFLSLVLLLLYLRRQMEQVSAVRGTREKKAKCILPLKLTKANSATQSVALRLLRRLPAKSLHNFILVPKPWGVVSRVCVAPAGSSFLAEYMHLFISLFAQKRFLARVC